MNIQVEFHVNSTDKQKKFLQLILIILNTGQKDFIAFEKQENRLLFVLNEADLESDHISIRKSLLKRY